MTGGGGGGGGDNDYENDMHLYGRIEEDREKVSE
jgi:hypothetical protein